MSLFDKAIRAAARPKSFWAMFAICFSAPILALPYLLLVTAGVIQHNALGFSFFLALIIAAFCFMLYYVNGLLAGRYRDPKGRPWSDLPW